MSDAASKQAVALSSVAASGGMVLMKLVVGLLTGSLGILSEAAHSGLDLGAASLTWWAVRAADQPADAEHPYGHGKFESFSALMGTLLLFLTAIGVAREAILHLIDPPEPVQVKWYGVGVILVSMAIDFARSRALARTAEATGSHALEADSLHFATDILSSGVVLIGLGGVWLGFPWADAAAALGVSVFIAHAGWDLGRRTFDVLVDAAPEGLDARIIQAVRSVPGVARIDRVRARPAGTTVFADITIKVSRALPLSQVEDVRRSVAKAVQSALGEIQALVVAEPLALDDETVSQTVHVLAAARNLQIHTLGVAIISGHAHVSFHLEVNAALTLVQAHDIASEFEAALHRELGPDLSVDIHLDPQVDHCFSGSPVGGPVLEMARHAMTAAIAPYPQISAFHNMVVQEREGGLYLSCHCLFPDTSPITEVHDIIETIEYTLMRTVHGLATVVVHAEPASHPE